MAMTPAQVAHIMSPSDDQCDAIVARVMDEVAKAKGLDHAMHLNADISTQSTLRRAIVRAAVEAALRDAPQQAEGWVMVPVDVLKAASESLGSFVSDHGWGDADMQAMDNLDAYLAARPSAPTAVEPDEQRYQLLRRGQHWSVIDGVGDVLRGDDLDAAVDSILATRASKGTPL